tara:strand:+ start:23039 stop:23233 length:195 start_codon:yes stop_codon:yes gene_type:complete
MDEKIKQLGDTLASLKTAGEAKAVGEALAASLGGHEPPSAGGAVQSSPKPSPTPLAAAASTETP